MADIVRLEENGVAKYIETHAKAVLGLKEAISSGLSKGEKIWSGAAYPQGDLTYPSKKLSECENGWILVLQSYKGGGVVNPWDKSYHPIPKAPVLANPGVNTKLESFNTGGASKVYKQVYLDDVTIKGHATNGEGTSASQVLSEVWSW